MEIGLATLGGSSLLLALALTLYALVVGVVGALRRDPRLLTSARLGAVATFLALTTAVAVLQAALITDDASVRYVATASTPLAPLWVKVVMMWGSLDGSILLWAWLLSGYTALLAAVAPNDALRPWALNVMFGVGLFFTGVSATISSPFAIVEPARFLGPGPNPLLQNHWMMAVHPVLMYLGFVGLSVPFAYAMSALITRRPGVEWMTQTRRWTLTGWGFLSAAIVAGGWWSYEVLGWGGYWAWDPVENVSFLPWLTATAFVHSVQVQERRRMLKSWNVLLIALTFAFTILGTFLTRSGVLSSVHAFGDRPDIGWSFLGFFLVALVGSMALIALRWDQVRDRAELDAAVSREGAFLAGNVLLLAMAFAVLLGTLFPLAVEAIAGERVTVGAPFFDQVSLPLWVAVLLLMGVGPLLPWRRAEGQTLKRNLAWMAGAAVALGALAWLVGVRKAYPLVTVALAGWNLASLTLLVTGVVVPRVRLGQRSALRVLGSFAHESRRRFGSMVVHLGVVIVALGVAGSAGYRVDEQIRIDFGSTATFGAYELTAVDRFMERQPDRISSGAIVEVRRGGRLESTLRPRLNVYAANTQQQQAIPTPAVMYRPTHDLYLNVTNTIGPDTDHVVLRVVRSPFVTWIWIGGAVLALGTVWCLLPDPRRARRRAVAPASADEHARTRT